MFAIDIFVLISIPSFALITVCILVVVDAVKQYFGGLEWAIEGFCYNRFEAEVEEIWGDDMFITPTVDMRENRDAINLNNILNEMVFEELMSICYELNRFDEQVYEDYIDFVLSEQYMDDDKYKQYQDLPY